MIKLLSALFIAGAFPLIAQHSRSLDTVLMGSSFTFTVVCDNAELTEKALQSALNETIRIEHLISSWDPKSETSAINRNAGIRPVHVSLELYQLIERAQKVSMLSDGSFDISFASIDKIWDFKCKDCPLPDPVKIEASVQKIDYRNIVLNPKDTSIYLAKEGMKIGFGAIGKGYAADRVKQLLTGMGIKSGVVNAGGDLTAWGTREDGKPWGIGIQDPRSKNNAILWIPASNQAVVTSGNYERYIDIDGVRYCHIIDPKTGWPVRNLSSVTIICPSAELADALATTVFVLGTDEGLKLINRLDGIECIIVDEGQTLHFSSNIASNYAQTDQQ